MITQHEFVNECQRYYAENYYEPGNPEDGEWQKCHYPKPKCLGGTETILLLKTHHQIQGLLQSLEFGHRCFGIEAVKRYLTNDIFADKWFELWDIYTLFVNKHVEKMHTQRAHQLASELGKLHGKERVKRLLNHPRYRERCHLGGVSTSKQRWKCTVTGHESNAGGLATWQKKRGIDPTNRERVG